MLISRTVEYLCSHEHVILQAEASRFFFLKNSSADYISVFTIELNKEILETLIRESGVSLWKQNSKSVVDNVITPLQSEKNPICFFLSSRRNKIHISKFNSVFENWKNKGTRAE